MADMSDVVTALGTTIQSILYPNGTSQPSVTGGSILIEGGWPDPKTLEADLAASKAHVSIYPTPVSTTVTMQMGTAEWDQLTNNGTTGTAGLELRRETRQFQITVWAATYGARDTLGSAIDVGLAVLERFTLPDTYTATLNYAGSRQDDNQQRSGIYRRDLFYTVQYPTTLIQTEYVITETIETLQVVADPFATPVVPLSPQITVTSP